MRDENAFDGELEQRPQRLLQVLVRPFSEPTFRTEAQWCGRGVWLCAGPQQNVPDCEGALVRQPVDDLCGTRRLERLDAARQRVACAEWVCDVHAAVPEGLSGPGRRPHVPGAQLFGRTAVPVHGHEHVVGISEVGRRIDRVDQNQAVRCPDGDRADVLFPVLVPRGPAIQPWSKFLQDLDCATSRARVSDRLACVLELLWCQPDV
jgi:hypothetical protein